MKQERSKVKSDILLRVRLLYVLFILAGAIVLARLVWVGFCNSCIIYKHRTHTEKVNHVIFIIVADSCSKNIAERKIRI